MHEMFQHFLVFEDLHRLSYVFELGLFVTSVASIAERVVVIAAIETNPVSDSWVGLFFISIGFAPCVFVWLCGQGFLDGRFCCFLGVNQI